MLEYASLVVFIAILCNPSMAQRPDSVKCELKGLINNKIICLLHNRGVNTKGVSTVINGVTTWKWDISKMETKEKDFWKYSGGLDRNQSFFRGTVAEDFKIHLHALIPSTKWCGENSDETPRSYDDLILFTRADKCCKNHEQCSPALNRHEAIQNISNIGLLKRFHCNCEDSFFTCLKHVNTSYTNRIGFTYFSVFGPQCFKEEYPVKNCSRAKKGRCFQYRLNEKQDKMFQWFDVPVF